jgi:hypothetical protein
MQIQLDLDNQRNELLAQLASTTAKKTNILQKQQKGLLANLDGVQKAHHQLKMVLEDSDSQAKALVMMEQLQQYLVVVEEVDMQPQELAEVVFQEVPYIIPEVKLTHSTADNMSVISTNNGFPLVLSSAITLHQLEITSTNHDEEQQLLITNSANTTSVIQPQHQWLGEKTVHVKLLGRHIKGSPIKVCIKPTWSPTQTKNTLITNNIMESNKIFAWGMIQEEFGMLPLTLILKINHKQTNKWAQIALYGSPIVQCKSGYPITDSLATYNTHAQV